MEVQNLKDSEIETQNKMASLNEKIMELETENKKLHDEFNVQRAKMKELFLQKEVEFNKEKLRLSSELETLKDELNDVRSQLLIANMKLETDLEEEKRKAHEEIASLQQLVHETIEESSTSRTKFDSEVRKFQTTIQQLQDENRDLRSLGQQSSPHHTPQESGSLVMLSTVTKTLARKLGADSFSGQESLEESMRRAQEDAEMLRSLLQPLEEEIRALKDKLRTTDEQLQRCQQCRHQETGAQAQNDGALNEETKCDMCSNYEAQLVREQQQVKQLQTRLSTAEKNAERQQEELRKEIGFRQDMETKWHEKTEEHRELVAVLSERTVTAEEQLQKLQSSFKDHSNFITKQLEKLTHEREHVQEHLIILQQENERLSGQYARHSQQLQSEVINLPDTVEELHERVLRLQEELIIALVAKEEAQKHQNTLEGENAVLQTQHVEIKRLYQDQLGELDLLKQNNHQLSSEQNQLLSMQEKWRQDDSKLQEQISQLKVQLAESQQTNRQLDAGNAELRVRVASLQQELDNSEQVQKDFVLLSQSLQVQLEKIRASDTAVRWQHEDDVDECPGCRTSFSNSRRPKHHCRHCGQIFCNACLTHTVASGPQRRPAPVCDVCHTLLVKSSAPYFSTEPPHSPD